MSKEPVPVKYFIYGMLVLALGISGLFYFLWNKEAKQVDMLKKNGIKASAWVIDVIENSATKKRGKKTVYDHSMEIAFFADTTNKEVEKDTLENIKVKNGPDLVDKIFNKNRTTPKPNGDYTKIKIPISTGAFKKYKANDKVDIVFLKEDITIARLAEELN